MFKESGDHYYLSTNKDLDLVNCGFISSLLAFTMNMYVYEEALSLV